MRRQELHALRIGGQSDPQLEAVAGIAHYELAAGDEVRIRPAPDTDARRYGEKRLPRLAQELTRAPPRLAGPDVLESGAGATPFVAARPVAPA